MKALTSFAAKLGAKLSLSTGLIVEKAGRYFLLGKNLKGLVKGDFYYAGAYLGKVKNGTFFPSFTLLAMLSLGRANKIVIDKKAAWLFICGRDVFTRGILSVSGTRRKGDYALIMSEFGECLGFGRIMCSLDAKADAATVAVKNISDVGDFLRREL
ncbi:MAG: hypothetical protein NWE94_07100 [Candidatus Bathyarchaeota archaeon]|nr:hypothetical protein [Candidatus Bathyarchaeota archaeon]